MKPEITATFRIKKMVARSLLTPGPAGWSSLAMAWEAKAPQP